MKNKQLLLDLQARFQGAQVLLVSPEEHAKTKERIDAMLDMPMDDNDMMDDPPQPSSSPVSFIPVFGELIKGTGLPDSLCDLLGICDTDTLLERLQEAGSDPNVNTVAMWFRSPGGQVTGIKEAADLINTISKSKTVIGYSDTLCASAAYWLASQCSALIVADTARIGNVGAYVERYDQTKQLADAGIKINIVQDGEYKTFGHPATVMSKEEEAMIQGRVSAIATDFRNDITTKRNIDTSLLQGQVFLGEEAVGNGFADGSMPDIQTMLTILVPLLTSKT